MKKILFSAAVAIALIACNGHEESPQIQEAVSIHENMRATYVELDSIMQVRHQQYLVFTEMVSQSGDTATQGALDNARDIILKLRGDLKDWNDELVEVPGHCFHKEGEAHSHDHAEEQRLAGMTDDQILEIQKELKTKLDAIEKQVRLLEQ
ncbi:MAG: hypothetical protein KDC12_12395 [Flavobacteriales bacterium]|nr:hypothetical protein [Flavobacteriales bacterium]